MKIDKNTRILSLYQKLIEGNRVNKQEYMLEYDITSRSFERDVNDIRLFLSDSYSGMSLEYDRTEKTYFFSNLNIKKSYLSEIECYVLAKLLLNTNSLNIAEKNGLLYLLFKSIDEQEQAFIQSFIDRCEIESTNSVPILKILQDLLVVMNNKNKIVLEMKNKKREKVSVIDIQLRNDSFCLYALSEEGKKKEFQLNDINKFEILREE